MSSFSTSTFLALVYILTCKGINKCVSIYVIFHQETPKLSQPDELSILKRSIAVIEKTHEVITILQDSDTESDTDDEMPDR